MEKLLNLSYIKEKINKKNIYNFLLRLFLVILPFICVFTISFFFGYKGTFKILVPVWNDEVSWFSQVDSIIKYGQPLGYIGYNETHAEIGTFGPWGVAPLLPYALFGKLFGWHFNSMAIANICFLSISLLMFIIMAKPNNKQTLLLIIAYLSLYITIGYSLTSMTEGLRYSCAIVLTGFIIWLMRITDNSNKNVSVQQKIFILIGCIFALYCVQVYLIFSLVVFVVAFLILRRLKINKIAVGIISTFITLCVAALSYMIVSKISCPYFAPSTIEVIISTIRSDGLYRGICFMLNNFFNNLGTVNYPELGNVGGSSRGILVWYFLMYVGLLFFIIKQTIQHIYNFKRNKNIDGYLILSLYFLLGFLVGYCMLYTGSSWTLCRGTNTGLIMAMFFLVFSNKEKYVHNYALISLFAVVSVWSYYGNIINERYSTAQFEEQINQEREKLSEIIDISPSNNPWNNTAAQYGNYSIWYLSFPTGMSFNGVFNGAVAEKSRYAVMPAQSADDSIESFKGNGYTLIFKDDVFAVFEKDTIQQ